MSFSLLVISSPNRLALEPAIVSQLFAAGLTTLHVRKPGWSSAEVEDYLRQVPANYHARLVLHGHPELVRRYRLGGLHLTGQQRAAAVRRPLQLPGQTLSTSFHSLAEIIRHRRRYDYVFLSPIFDSLSKQAYVSGFRLPVVRTHLALLATRTSYQPQVLALGGVTAENIDLLPPVGFVGAAALGAVWQSPDPAAAFRQLQEEVL
jgi:thiamine-phosphate pyrophosphorylase